MVSKTEETHISAELGQIHERLISSQDRIAENRQAYRMELTNLTVRLDYIENNGQKGSTINLSDRLEKFNSLFDKITEEINFLKAKFTEKDGQIDNLAIEFHNKISHIEAKENSVLAEGNYVKYDEVKSLISEISVIREKIDEIDSHEKHEDSSYLTTKDLRGLVIEIHRISQELPSFVSENQLTKLLLEFKGEIEENLSPAEVMQMIGDEIEKIWPLVDDIVVNAAIEIKERAYNRK